MVTVGHLERWPERLRSLPGEHGKQHRGSSDRLPGMSDALLPVCRKIPMANYELGIVAVAVDIASDTIARFVESVRQSVPTVSLAEPCIVTEKDVGSPLQNLAAAKNLGVKKLLDSCQTIVCTDIDILVPPELIDHTSRTASRGRVNVAACYCRRLCVDDIEPTRWRDWKGLPLRPGWGAWNGMSARTWLSLGGWNECFQGWGYEDKELHWRCKQKGIEIHDIRQFPLINVKGKQRSWRNQTATARNKKLYEDIKDGQHPSVLTRNWLDPAGRQRQPDRP